MKLLILPLILFSIKNLNFRSDLKKLFPFTTAETHFRFNGKFYDQVDGVAICNLNDSGENL